MAVSTPEIFPPKRVDRDNGKSDIPADKAAEALDSAPENEEAEAVQLVGNVLQIPKSELTPEREKELKGFLRTELQRAEGERGEFVRKLARWKEVYHAPTADGPKHFPIYNSSNMTIPLVKEIVNTLAAQLVQSTLTAHPTWVTKDLAGEWEPFVDDVERFLDIAARRDLELPETAVPWILEAAKLGTSILEVGHEVDIRKVKKYSADGKKTYDKKVVRKDGPTTTNIPLTDFYIRFHETDINRARWCAKRLWFPEWLLRERERQNRFQNVEEVIKGGQGTKSDDVERVHQEVEKTKPTDYHPHEVFDMWVSWDIDGDGELEELRVFYNRKTDTILSAQYHPYWHGRRPFVKIVYFPVEHRFYGEGLCEMLEDIQAGVSDKHNKRADNETLANLKMFVKRKMVKGLQPGDPLYSGKIIEVNDIWNDLRELQMSEIYPSTVNSEQILRSYADRLAGHSEAMSGSAAPVSRTTAAAQLALLQEQAKRIDLTVRNIRAGLNQVGGLTVELYFQFGTNGKAIAWLGRKSGLMVEGVFRLPRRIHELGMALSVQTPTSLQNRQVKRESSIALFNLLSQMYERMLPFVQHLAPDRMGEVASAMAQGASRFLEDVLETFEVTDPEALLAGLTVLEKVLPNAEDFGGMEAHNRGAEAAQISDQLGRLEDLLGQADDSRTRGDGVSGSSGNARGVAAEEGIRRGNRSSFPLGGSTNNRS